VGFVAAASRWSTQTLSTQSFEPVQVESLTCSGPSADTPMFFLTPDAGLDFDVGLAPGVVIDAFAAALLAGEWK
jgi:hypothetical protein